MKHKLEDCEEVTWQECYRSLAHAVIASACEDYIRIAEDAFRKNSYARKQLEAFFRSRTFILYTDDAIDPEYLIAKLKEKRDWNSRMRTLIRERYGSHINFGKALYPNNRRKQRDCVRVWLKSAAYPPDLELWREELGE